MARATVQTNLLGRRAKVAMGLTDAEIELRNKDRRSSDVQIWRHLGEEGEIVVVTMKEDSPYISIRKDDGNIVESWLSHFRILPPGAKNAQV